MADDKTPLALAIKELATRARNQEGTAILPDELLAYHHGELSADREEALRERLALQPEAVRAIQDLRRFPDIGPVDESCRLDDSQLDTDRQAMWARLSKELGRDGGAASAVPLFERRSVDGGWWMPGLVAASLLITLGLSFWVVSLRRTVDELTGPRINVQVSSLVPQARVRDPEPQTLSLPPGTDHLLLILNLPNLEHHSDYRIAIWTAEGMIWSRDGLERSLLGNFTIELPRSDLPAGDYRIELFGLGRARPQSIATYSFHLQPTPRE